MDLFGEIDKKKKTKKSKSKKPKSNLNDLNPSDSMENINSNAIQKGDDWIDEDTINISNIKTNKFQEMQMSKGATATPLNTSGQTMKNVTENANDTKKEENKEASQTASSIAASGIPAKEAPETPTNENATESSSLQQSSSSNGPKKFVPMAMRGNRGDSSPAAPSDKFSNLTGPRFGMGLRRPPREMPKVNDQSHFPTLGNAMTDTKIPEGYSQVKGVGGNANDSSYNNKALDTSNRFGTLQI